MSTILFLLLQMLHDTGVPISVCANHQIRLGEHRCNVLPPPPPPNRGVMTEEETNTISNGF